MQMYSICDATLNVFDQIKIKGFKGGIFGQREGYSLFYVENEKGDREYFELKHEECETPMRFIADAYVRNKLSASIRRLVDD